ncbi:MAG: ribosome biogenesis GTP-binding protein YihA/YsxC [Holosporales bacterium]|nr:ribosome biogenesis GTP-binding protein YihA/YsxC [Holosporales bacterium]
MIGKDPVFLLSVYDPDKIPPPLHTREVALLGTSNVGKSSLLSEIANKNNLARASKTPGKTRCINFFHIPPEIIIADIPGFGFSKAPKAVSGSWQELVETYLRNRGRSLMAYLLIDGRRGIRPLDIDVMVLLAENNVGCKLVFTKIDKLNVVEKESLAGHCSQAICGLGRPLIEMGKPFMTSAKNSIGIQELRKDMLNWGRTC